MGAKFVAAIIGVIILVVLVQTFILGGDDGVPSASNPSSLATATVPVNPSPPVLLGESGSSGGSSGGGQSSGGSAPTKYTVQSGDTLGAIAEDLGVPADEQAAWIAEVLELNGMEDARQLQAGQELILPNVPGSIDSGGTQDESPTPLPTAPPAATGTIATPTPRAGAADVYVVVEGDYPYLIALKHCVDDPDAWVAELLDINAIDPTSLSIGQELILPPGTPPYCGEP